jgi:plasmid stabilization system protein ParE
LVTKGKLPVRWDRTAKSRLDAIYDFIAKDSETAARKVKKALVHLARSLGEFPEKFPREEYLIFEPENYRSVSRWSYKIIYEFTDDCVIIVDIFHTSQHPSKMLENESE